jgi:hypothetical protein
VARSSLWHPAEHQTAQLLLLLPSLLLLLLLPLLLPAASECVILHGATMLAQARELGAPLHWWRGWRSERCTARCLP